MIWLLSNVIKKLKWLLAFCPILSSSEQHQPASSCVQILTIRNHQELVMNIIWWILEINMDANLQCSCTYDVNYNFFFFQIKTTIIYVHEGLRLHPHVITLRRTHVTVSALSATTSAAPRNTSGNAARHVPPPTHKSAKPIWQRGFKSAGELLLLFTGQCSPEVVTRLLMFWYAL